MNSPLNRWVVTAAVVLLAFLGLFWREVAESLGEGVASLIGTEASAPVLHDADLPHLQGVRLESERDNVYEISVSDQRVERVSAGQGAVVSATMTSRTRSNNYPHLRVTLYKRSGALSRVVEYAPSEYTHGQQLTAERISMVVQKQEGEAQFVIEPFYPKGAPR